MRFAIIRFPGTWSDRDCAHILQNILGQKADILWHKEENLGEIKPGSPEFKGREIFNRMACNACHSIDGTLKLGPTILNQYGKN